MVINMSLYSLPFEVVALIADNCLCKDICRLLKTCRRFHSILKAHIFGVDRLLGGSSALAWSAEYQNKNILSLALRLGKYWAYHPAVGKTLVKACRLGHQSVVELLLRMFPLLPINMDSCFLRTTKSSVILLLLNSAAARRSLPLFRHEEMYLASTALTLACQYERKPLVPILLDMHPQLQLDFVFANATNHTMVQFLGECALKWGKRVFFPVYVIGNPPRSIQRTIHEADLWEACSRGDVDKVRHLCEIGTTLDMESSDGDSLLHHAVRKGHVSVVRELLSLGAPVDSGSADMGIYDAVAAAIRSRNPEIVRILLDAKVPYNEEHALRWAIQCFDAELISLVLPDPNKRFSGGRTTLHLAVELGLLKPAAQLLELKTLICRDDAGVTPRDIAEDNGYSDFLELFRKLGK
jgi:hypothetical protein